MDKLSIVEAIRKRLPRGMYAQTRHFLLHEQGLIDIEIKEVICSLAVQNNQKCHPRIMHEYWTGWITIDMAGSIR